MCVKTDTENKTNSIRFPAFYGGKYDISHTKYTMTYFPNPYYNVFAVVNYLT